MFHVAPDRHLSCSRCATSSATSGKIVLLRERVKRPPRCHSPYRPQWSRHLDSAEAVDAVAATQPGGRHAERRSDGKLKARPESGTSYFDLSGLARCRGRTGTSAPAAKLFAWRALTNPGARCSPRADSLSRTCAGRSVLTNAAPRRLPRRGANLIQHNPCRTSHGQTGPYCGKTLSPSVLQVSLLP
jgi:hypothetical protein